MVKMFSMEALKRGQKDKGGHWGTDLKAQHILLSLGVSGHHAPLEFFTIFCCNSRKRAKKILAKKVSFGFVQ